MFLSSSQIWGVPKNIQRFTSCGEVEFKVLWNSMFMGVLLEFNVSLNSMNTELPSRANEHVCNGARPAFLELQV